MKKKLEVKIEDSYKYHSEGEEDKIKKERE